MSQPSNVTVTIDSVKFNAYSAHFGLDTHHDDTGMPNMGQVFWSITVSLDLHDTVNLPFSGLKTLFEMASTPVRANIKPIKIQLSKDDAAQDAIATFSFDGWIASMGITGGGGVNHEMNLKLVPKLNREPYTEVKIGN